MATPVVYNGVSYSIPAFGDVGYAQGPGNLSSYLIALSSGLQQTGGLFSLTAPLNFGPNFGVIAVNYTSTSANPATAGAIRLANADTIDWRNFANSANLALGVNASDQLTFNGSVLSTAAIGGTVSAGVAGRITLYPASGNTVDDVYVQNAFGIDILIAAQAARSVALEYTIPNPGNAVASATFALLELAQTFTAVQTFNVSPVVPNGTTTTQATNFTQLQTKASNILDNGGFEIWQRGITFSAPASGVYLADRWKTVTDEAANVTVTKETTVIDSVGLASMKVVVTASGASHFWFVQQTVENYADYRGKNITLSARVNTNVATAVRLRIQDGVSIVNSAYHTGGGGWETLTVSLAVDAAAGSLNISIGMLSVSLDKKNGTYYWDSAMLSLGSEAIAFVGTNPQVDLSRCQRYFQRYGGNFATEQISVGLAYGTTNFLSTLLFRVQFRVTPTATVTGAAATFQVFNNAAGVINCATFGSNTLTPISTSIFGSVAAGLVAGNATIVTSSVTTSFIDYSADF
jgi:hypothetical protein